MHTYFIVTWRRPRERPGRIEGMIRKDHGDCEQFFDEDEIIRQIEDYDVEPEIIVQMVSDDARNWRAHPYTIDMNQVRKDAWADAWQMKARFG